MMMMMMMMIRYDNCDNDADKMIITNDWSYKILGFCFHDNLEITITVKMVMIDLY